ncbi:MAG: phosphate ABC transporter permease subunit PstC [Spirochaetales bacterium]
MSNEPVVHSANVAGLLRRRLRPGENVIQVLLVASALVSILTTFGIIAALLGDALRLFFYEGFSFWDFFTGTYWDPSSNHFGIWALLSGTLMTSLVAMVVAVPVGMAIGIYLSEYASARVARTLKPVLEILAGIPSIVYGYFAINFVTPSLQAIMGDLIKPLNALSAGMVMGILILPLIASMAEDALGAVPKSLKQAGFAMGATKLEVALQITLPAATSGIVAAIILGLSRAIGETMIVALAAGSFPRVNLNPLGSVDTMTGYIVRTSGGDIPQSGIEYISIFAIGLTLFVITLGLNIISRRIIEHFREVYE